MDETYRWYVISNRVLEVRFPGNGWLTSDGFEQAVRKAGSLLECSMPAASFIFGDGCKIIMDALARLLAFSNQLVAIYKSVTLDSVVVSQPLHILIALGFLSIFIYLLQCYQSVQ